MSSSTGATDASAKIFNVFHDKLQNEWKLKTCCGRCYYLTSNIVKWMRRIDTNEPTINAGLLLTEAYKGQYVHHPNSSTIANEHDRCLVVFSILLELGHGHLIDSFQRYGITDKRLPIRTISEIEPLLRYLKSNKKLDNTGELWQRFQEKMWLYCPCPLELDMRSTFLDPEHGRWIMPFRRRQRVNLKGGTAQVWEVTVQESLVSKRLAAAVARSRYEDSSFGTCYTFALKTFTEESQKVFEWERDAYLAVRAGPELPGMVRYLGEYEIDEVLENGELIHTWNILLEYGDQDLEEFFASLQNYPPILNSETIQFWKSLANVAKALNAMHNLKLERENGHHDTFSGWHCDLKPDNILRVDDEFKLADFGFAKFKPMNPNSFPPKERLTGGTETYGAPECDRARSDPSVSVSQTIDIWSFGCVLSVSATWVVVGYQGVLAYHKLRQSAIKKLRDRRANGENVSVPVADDAFHDGVDVLPEVKEWHNYLRSVLRVSDTITGRILDLVDERMLRTESARQPGTPDLCAAIEEQLRLAQASMKGNIDDVAESVRNALLEVESEQGNASENSQETDGLATPIKDVSLSIDRPRHQYKSSRVKKSQRMGEVVQGRVAHRQVALAKDERLRDSNPIESPVPRRMIDSHHTETISINKAPYNLRLPRIQPIETPSLQDTTYTSVNHSPFLTPPGISVEKEAISSPTHSISPSPDYGIPRTESPSHEEINVSSQLPEWRAMTSNSGSRQSRMEPRFTLPWSSKLFSLDPGWPISMEHQAQRSKDKNALTRFFKKDRDNYLKNFLVNRDIMFLVDNDTAMYPYWDSMTTVLETLVAKVDSLDKNGLDLEFTVGDDYKTYNARGNKLLPKFEAAKQEALSRRYHIETDMAKNLNRIFDKYLLDTRREMTLIVLTDGDWRGTLESRDVERAIADFLKKPALTQRLQKRWFTIQFIAFGPDVPDILKHLDDDIGKEYHIPDVVDVEHVSGDVYKMILGSFVDQYDAVEPSPVSPASPSTPSYLAPPFTMEPSSSTSLQPVRTRSLRSLSGIRNMFNGDR
ncbi:hypothetical protein F5Y04DRAFT_259958 [Hypomontagnella monticulosa]|nr:hypothetical protein F5Y04DRAFT_259958 [Hypomontagnella monticulosa]